MLDFTENARASRKIDDSRMGRQFRIFIIWAKISDQARIFFLSDAMNQTVTFLESPNIGNFQDI